MKMKNLCALAVLLTSSLAGAAGSKAVSNSAKDQYYAGLNVGGGWGNGLKIKPSVVFGYNYDKNSTFELEVLTDVGDMFIGETKKMGASLLANYRYYLDLDTDPVKLYIGAGLGGYLQVIPFGFGVGNAAGGGDAKGGSTTTEAGAISGTTVPAIYGSAGDSGSSLVDKILSSVSYKLKVGVDYEITPQIVGAVGISVGGQLSGFKPPIQIPDAIFEVGVRYNF